MALLIINIISWLAVAGLFGLSWLSEGFRKNKISTKTITIMAMLSALSVILTNVIGYTFIGGQKIMIGNVFIFISGMVFGPVPGVLTGVVSDLLGLINLGGGYNAGFMFIKCMFGFLGACVFMFRKNNFWMIKMIIIYILGITVHIFLLSPLLNAVYGPDSNYWTSLGIKFTLLITKPPLWAIECSLYPFIAYTSFRVIWHLMKNNLNDQNVPWFARKGDHQSLYKPLSSMTDELKNVNQKRNVKQWNRFVKKL
ncbi:folate family ECF transporter S component [Mesoplasma photuris]|uniref:folate family ECF transporter S component n=1 Tax=Mesoplasma photuris TaxID=217731 RepID=UPI00068B5F6B|nr:folate family ECF transporter S component [Mesoplasma photuris]